MRSYWVKTPVWLPWLLPKGLIWRMPAGSQPVVYLTFDDGPHPSITPFVLDQLSEYQAKATFFCIGKNVAAYPDVYSSILHHGHAVGNHTYNHLNGWKTKDDVYIQNIRDCQAMIPNLLFRPPYGRIRRSQVQHLLSGHTAWKIVMWDILSGDFDLTLSPETCLKQVLQHIQPGSIVVFHDSEKAWDRMSYCLPRILQYCREKQWALKSLSKRYDIY